MALIGLDIGGTNLKAVHLATDGTVLGSAVRPAGGFIPREALLALAVDLVRDFDAGAAPVGIAVGGAIQPDGTMREGATNLPNLAGLPLADTFSRRLGRPCRVDHDGRAAMRGEAWSGAARGARNAMTVTFGTGIGAGLLLGGRIHAGTHLCAGEIGLWRLLPSGPSAPAVAFEDLAAPGGRSLGRRGPDYAALIAAAAGAPDAEECAIVFDLVGRALANAQLLLDLEVIVLIGGVTALGEPFRAAVEAAFVLACPSEFRRGVDIRLGMLGSFCGAIGAAALWLEDRR